MNIIELLQSAAVRAPDGRRQTKAVVAHQDGADANYLSSAGADGLMR